MKNVIVAWCNTNEQVFETQVPLLLVGKRNQELGFKGVLHVVFVDGFDLLSKNYKDLLCDVGFVLHDAQALYGEFESAYKALDRFGDYEKKCFLRWLVLERLFAGEPLIHYDGDIVFNEDPAVIAEKVKNKTFVLQGCPAFTVIHNKAWFERYNEQLNLFVQDIEGYSQQAWQQREGWEITFKTRWAGSRFRKIITSDQDFLSHLIHTGNIHQDSVESVSMRLQDYLPFENPLFIHMYDDNFPYSYSRENNIDYFSAVRRDGQDCFYKKRILFWHMQSCFNYYLSKFVLRKKILWPGRVPLTLSATTFEDRLNKFINRFTGHISRARVYKYFFETHDFSGIFKDVKWWKRGIFV
jgi:hypothetical protein